MRFILFGTSACHLCEQANDILSPVLIQFPKIQLELVDIAEQVQWQERYAVKIPVLYDVNTQSELNWPFNETDITTFISKLNHD
ncbi:MAG: glutaredoxin family protein [Methylococcales bacterium]|nr:glutaredoxin family protein [Methylococcales bacterium]MCK5924646.1 glutaredoxin family protein [Methylococcales bacterium]